MIGNSDWHKHVPTDPVKNVRFRLKLLEACKADPLLRKGVWEMCRQDIIFYINTFVWQHNPKKKDGDEVGPFICWDYEKSAILGLIHQLYEVQEDEVWKKSRDMGATWMALIVPDWTCLFFTWKAFLYISHTEEAVEKTNRKNTLFYKIQFMHDLLPGWITRGVTHTKLAFNYKATNSTIEGGATTERSGVGGRSTAVILDEFSKHEKDFEIWSNTRDVGPRLVIGTFYGIDKKFNELARDKDLKVVTMHWSQHPDKRRGLYRYHPDTNRVEALDKSYVYPAGFEFVTDGYPRGGPHPFLRSVWYDRECRARKRRTDIAMHLDIDDQGSVEQFFDPILISTWQERWCVAPLWRGRIAHNDKGEPDPIMPWVKDSKGPLSLWFNLRPDSTVPVGLYKIAGDVGMGRGVTNTILTIFNAHRGEKVAEWASPGVEPDLVGKMAVALARLFVDEDGTPAEIGWEKPGPGVTMGDTITKKLNFWHVYRPKRQEHGLYEALGDEPGWQNNDRSVAVILEQYYDALKLGQFINPSRLALEECKNFRVMPDGKVQHGNYVSINDPTGARVNHADRVIADALAWWMSRSIKQKREPEEHQEIPYNSLAWRRQFHEQQSRENRYGWSRRRA